MKENEVSALNMEGIEANQLYIAEGLNYVWCHVYEVVLNRIKTSKEYRKHNLLLRDYDYLPIHLFYKMFPQSSFMKNDSAGYIWNKDSMKRYHLSLVRQFDSIAMPVVRDFEAFLKAADEGWIATQLKVYVSHKIADIALLDSFLSLPSIPREIINGLTWLKKRDKYGYYCMGSESRKSFIPPYYADRLLGVYESLRGIQCRIIHEREIGEIVFDYEMETAISGAVRRAEDQHRDDEETESYFLGNIYKESIRDAYFTGVIDGLNEIVRRQGEHLKPSDDELYRLFYKIESFDPAKVTLLVHYENPGEDIEGDFITVKYKGLKDERKNLNVFRKIRLTDSKPDEARSPASEKLVTKSARKLLADIAISSTDKERQELIGNSDPDAASQLNTLYRRLFGDPKDGGMISRKDKKLLIEVRMKTEKD